MDSFKCEAPGCLYTCTSKHQIHSHHIVPKEKGGTNSNFNRVRLCPNCHNKIYIPEATKGIHSIKTSDYIILKKIHPSSNGLVLEYEDRFTTGFTQCDYWRDSYIDRIRLLG
jgi:hypothetical protein